MIITSACRCPKHNRAVGGKKNSTHVTTKKQQCKGVDIKYPKSTQKRYILMDLLFIDFDRIFVYKTHVHVDVDNKKPCPAFSIYL
jgi:hypothetical protein